MPSIFLYLLKVTISLSVVFLFYYFILRKLTFYNHNRWYLLGYTLLSFFIPFINISPVLKQNDWDQSRVVNWLPGFTSGSAGETTIEEGSRLTAWDAALILLIAGMIIMLSRFVLQVVSFQRMKKKAKVIHAGGMHLYQVDEPIIPFSFGHSIFINSRQHTEQELQEIISHEFVHVKQLHSIDMIWCELFCMINWFNPFAWLLRHSIRQNLEFIADNKVLEKGINRKQYQYLLLKVIGNNQFSIASNFNFSSLKKRIAMMNKLKSTKKQLLRLLFLLPATAVLLLAFRSRWTGDEKQQNKNTVAVAGLVVDAITMEPLNNASIFIKEKNMTVTTDERGYYLAEIPFENKPLSFTMLVSKKGYSSFHQTENWGNFTEASTYDRYSKTIEFFGLSPRGEENRSFSSLAGNGATLEALSYKNVVKRLQELRSESAGEDWDDEATDTIPVAPRPTGENLLKEFLKRNPDVKRVGWVFDNSDDAVHIIIIRKDGTTEEYNLENDSDVQKAEAKYGKLPVAPPPPPPPPSAPGSPGAAAPHAPAVPATGAGAPAPPAAPAIPKMPEGVKSMQVNNKKVVMILKNGTKEEYDLNNADEKRKFREKYGDVIIEWPAKAPGTATGQGMSVYPAATGVKEVVVVGYPSSKVKEEAIPAPLYVLDGKIVSKEAVNAVSPESISVVNVLKGEKAVAAYGSKGENGVVEVNTKKEIHISSDKIVVSEVAPGSAPAESDIVAETPELAIAGKQLMILDGKEVPADQRKLRGRFKLVSLDKEQGLKKYGEKGKNGVVELTTVR